MGGLVVRGGNCPVGQFDVLKKLEGENAEVVEEVGEDLVECGLEMNLHEKEGFRDFPGGPAAKTPSSQ